MRDDIENEILKLVLDRHPESAGLDYKRILHRNKAERLHDILCLANARHTGWRYLVFGMDDDFTIVGINDPIQNHDMIDWLNGVSFANKPTIWVGNLDLNGKTLGYIAIEDEPRKPFYLSKDYSDQGKTVTAGTIYTRNNSGNTPIRSKDGPTGISNDQLDWMFRERFGLNLTPHERMIRYLYGPAENWQSMSPWESGDTVWHHKQFPEFTLRRTTPEKSSYTEAWHCERFDEEPQPARCDLVIANYYATQIDIAQWVCFDEWHRMYSACVSPDRAFINGYMVHFYIKGSARHAMQVFFSNLRGRDDSKGIWTKRRRWDIPVITEAQRDEFVASQSPNDHTNQARRPEQKLKRFLDNQQKLADFLGQPAFY